MGSKKNQLQLRTDHVYKERFWDDPECLGILTKGLEEGRDLKTSCESIGVTKELYNKALQEGYKALLLPVDCRTDDEKALANFYVACKTAVSEFEQTAVHTILKAAKYGDWKAAAWLLERRLPEVYGKRELPPLQPEGDSRAQAIKVEIIDANDEATQNRLANLEAEVRADLGRGGNDD